MFCPAHSLLRPIKRRQDIVLHHRPIPLAILSQQALLRVCTAVRLPHIQEALRHRRIQVATLAHKPRLSQPTALQSLDILAVQLLNPAFRNFLLTARRLCCPLARCRSTSHPRHLIRTTHHPLRYQRLLRIRPVARPHHTLNSRRSTRLTCHRTAQH